MTPSVEKLLEIYGPSLSTDLKDKYVQKYKLSEAAARQKISRADNNVYKLRKLPFPRNATFVYLRSQYGSPDYWSALHQALLKTKSAYGLAISALHARRGMMPYEHFKIACGAPLRQKKHLSPEEVRKRLIYAGILKSTTFNEQEVLYLAQLENIQSQILSELQGRLVAEKVLLRGLYKWCTNLGLVSFKQLKVRDKGELPVISTTAWDLAGPSYLSGLTKFDSKNERLKPGFIGMDVLLNYIVTENDVAPYLKKLDALKQLRNVGPSIHFFVAFEYTSGAFRKLKEAGVSPATVRNLFGKDVAEGFNSLISTLVQTANTVNSPEKLNELFDTLGKLEGAASLLRGTLFEFLIAEVIRATSHPASLELNKIVKTVDSKQAEIDVFAPQSIGQEILIAECKGLNPKTVLPDDEVEKWLNTRVSTVRQYCNENSEWRNKNLTFQLWTTGLLSDESLKNIQHAMATRKKYRIEVFDQNAIEKKLKEAGLKKLLKTYRVHFLRLPSVG